MCKSSGEDVTDDTAKNPSLFQAAVVFLNNLFGGAANAQKNQGAQVANTLNSAAPAIAKQTGGVVAKVTGTQPAYAEPRKEKGKIPGT